LAGYGVTRDDIRCINWKDITEVVKNAESVFAVKECELLEALLKPKRVKKN
jgi:hypothetical protein